MAASRTMLALLVVGSIIIVASGQKGKGTEKEYLGGTVYGGRSQQALLVEWVKSLKPELDYMGTRHWKQMCHSNSAEHYFNEYNERFSKIAERLGASVNFISIGACDGTNDDTIKDRFLAHSHWNGVFVEPMSNNFADLTNFLAINEVANRSTAIRGAATATCTSPFLEVQRPLTEEKDPNSAHWLRRQIGSILPDGQKTKQGWTTEKVRCLTPEDILLEWGIAASNGRRSSNGKNKKRRPHVLKIDVEGHDYAVLTGFLKETTLVSDLPLMILFEAKILGDKFPVAKKRLEEIGYVVADESQDGFALLRGEMVFVPGERGVNSHLKGVTLAQHKRERGNTPF